MKKKFKKVFLFSLMICFTLIASQTIVYAEVASDAKSEVTMEITEDWEPKLPSTKQPTPSTPSTPKKSGILPQTGEEKAEFLALLGIGVMLVVVASKMIKERKNEQ